MEDTERVLSLLEPSRLRATLDGLIEGLQVLGPEWRYLYVNEAVARHGKKPREELLGRTMLECYPGIEQTEAFAVLERCMRERRAEVFENEFVYEDGSRAWFEIRVEPCAEGIAILSLDVTERKRLEQEVRRADRLRALGEMAAGVAHDLRNILNPLVLQLEILRRRHDRPDADGIIGRMARVLRDGNEIVDRLRGVARLEPAPPTGPIEPDPIAAEAIELARLHANMIGAPVEVVDETGGAPPIRAAAAELRSATLNLLINAIDAMPEGGRAAHRGRRQRDLDRGRRQRSRHAFRGRGARARPVLHDQGRSRHRPRTGNRVRLRQASRRQLHTPHRTRSGHHCDPTLPGRAGRRALGLKSTTAAVYPAAGNAFARK